MPTDKKRAARACDECRRLKEKCEGGIPCSRCSHSHRSCEFKNRASRVREFRAYIPRTRSPAVGADIRELAERSRYMECILKHTVQGISLDTDNLSQMANALASDQERHRELPVEHGDVDGLSIDDEACTIDPVEDTTTHYSGEFSYWNFSMRIKHQIEHQTRHSVAQQTPNSDQRVFEYWRAQQLRSGQSHLSAAVSSCPPRQIARFLANIFFKYAETHYFFVRKRWFLDNLDVLYHDPSSFGKKGAAVISILLTIFAIGTQYAYLDSPSRDTAKDGDFSEDDIGATFYQSAVRLLPEIIESSCLESVQACLLFGFYSLPIDASGLGYVYINLAVRLAMQNGMHRKCTSDAFNPDMIETRNRVWWTAYSLERKISIFHGRPLSVLRSDVDTDVPEYREGMHAEDPLWNVARAVTSIQLIHFLEDFFHELSLLRHCEKKTIPNILARLRDKKCAMTDWWNSIPEDVLGYSSQPQNLNRAAMHLRLEYCLVNMFIGRPFLLRDQASQSPRSSPAGPEFTNAAHDNSEGSSPRQTSSTQGLVICCIQAATEVIRLCQILRDHGSGLARASYIEYSSCRASLLVLIAYSIQNRSGEYHKTLQDGLDMIREMAASGDSARSEVALIEALEQALARLHSETEDTQPNDGPSETISAMSDYDAFKQWGSSWRGGGAMNMCDNVSIPANTAGASAGSALPPINFDPTSVSYMEPPNLSASSNESRRDMQMDALNAWDPVNELSIFGAGNLALSSAWPTQTETQVLEQFLAVPEAGIVPRPEADGPSGFVQMFPYRASHDARTSRR
ncbi:fungal-specific transcription factor domain-containing protein [Aspergillus pseudotamarii]|uniref:Fungal-specific transcription factor domain-containing protein n=1 Tax=Aspergillus pseudotamarii TaxID=132259 RepID=A0A5N6SXD1_ASPPS|nr:fungal-specific transcription factor domain-containing protein [Aspergillus pseudotamarii]KAE8137784.1 fungal-specific transcription factor domain-containing protein [Aspergillus pseudotamarii]